MLTKLLEIPTDGMILKTSSNRPTIYFMYNLTSSRCKILYPIMPSTGFRSVFLEYNECFFTLWSIEAYVKCFLVLILSFLALEATINSS